MMIMPVSVFMSAVPLLKLVFRVSVYYSVLLRFSVGPEVTKDLIIGATVAMHGTPLMTVEIIVELTSIITSAGIIRELAVPVTNRVSRLKVLILISVFMRTNNLTKNSNALYLMLLISLLGWVGETRTTTFVLISVIIEGETLARCRSRKLTRTIFSMTFE